VAILINQNKTCLSLARIINEKYFVFQNVKTEI
jgi:hypothetical protein